MQEAISERPTPAPRPRASSDALALYDALASCIESGLTVAAPRSALVEAALEIRQRPGFDHLTSLPRLRFDPLPHQLDAVRTVLRRMRGRAILADEVGLGKTIEAALVLMELRLRGLAPRSLILTPAGLVGQWAEELERKFALPVSLATSRSDADGTSAEVVLASIAAARRQPLRETITSQRWDCVIVDEAHRLKTARSASSTLVRSLRSRSLLLLTATPVENRLEDIFALVNIVQPGRLGTAADFRSRHGGRAGGSPEAIADLRRQLADVMVRSRRSEVAIRLPQRIAETVRLKPPPPEAELYESVSARVRERARAADGPSRLALQTVQRLAGSSPAALAPTLVRLGWDDLAARASALADTAKRRALAELLRRHTGRRERVVVFTAFRETLEDMSRLARDLDVPVSTYHGSLTRREKDEAVRRFHDDVDVLLTTEAAGEGRNLQFCHTMINVDLPWNPMRIEQRLGRIHRIGQGHDVLLTNLVNRGTIEDRMLRILEERINLFQLVVGELDMILGRVEEDFDFDAAVFAAHVESDDPEQLDGRLGALGDALARAREEYLDVSGRVDSLLPDAPATREDARRR